MRSPNDVQSPWTQVARRVARLFPVVRVLAVLVIAFHAASAQHGRIVTDTVRSASLANLLGAPAETRVSTYLPPGYDASPLTRFPVVYLLHGYGTSDVMWVRPAPRGVDVAGVMDSLIAAHGSREMIVVMPNASNPYGGSFYTNSTTTGNWEDFIVHDLVSYVDGKFRTLARPESRGLAGASMGGYGALYLGAQHGGVTYSAIYAMSACCTARWSFDPARNGAMWDSVASFTSIDAARRNGRGFTTIMAAIAAAFSPNANRPPLFLDLPVDRDGAGWKPNAAVVAEWDAHSPLVMIPSHSENLLRLRAIQFDIGLQDEAVPPREIMNLDSAFSRAAIPHTFETYAGTHTDHTRDRLATRVLPFFSRVLVFEAKQ
jgi:S-formylglutathione hydrolase FrmB